GEAAIASLNAAKSSGPYLVGRHILGLWLKIWIDSQPRSAPRSIALSRPPDVETCAPISMRRASYGAVWREGLPSGLVIHRVDQLWQAEIRLGPKCRPRSLSKLLIPAHRLASPAVADALLHQETLDIHIEGLHCRQAPCRRSRGLGVTQPLQ